MIAVLRLLTAMFLVVSWLSATSVIASAASPLAALPMTASAQGAPRGFSALKGRVLPGTRAYKPGGDSGWNPIGPESSPPTNVGGLASTPLVTYPALDGLLPQVEFLAFKTKAAATKFYESPPARWQDSILSFNPLDGPTGVPSPSRGLDIFSCADGVKAGRCVGANTCSGYLSTAIILQRGKIVVLAEGAAPGDPCGPSDRSTQGDPAATDPPSALASDTPYAKKALSLLHQVKLA